MRSTHDDRARLAELERRCAANGVRTEMIGPERLRELEPHVAGVAALHVLDTGIVDYGTVCRALAAEIEAAGASIRLESAVLSGVASASGLVVETSSGPVEARRVVTCAGLHADEVARSISGPEAVSDIRVVAFRGEYHELVPSRAHLVRGLVYPVPDPQFPFLGVHLTRGIDGHVHVGPNAVLAFAREGYQWRRIDLRHLRKTMAFSGFRRFAAQQLALRRRRDGALAQRAPLREGGAAVGSRARARRSHACAFGRARRRRSEPTAS